MTYFGKLLLNSYHFACTYYSAYTPLVLQYIRPCSLWRQRNPEDAPRICFGILKLQTSPGTHEQCVSQCSVADLYHQLSFCYFFLRQNLPNLPRLTINWCRHSELRRMHGPPVLAPQELEIICLSSPQIHHSLLLESQLLLNWFLCIRYKRSHSDWAGGDSDTMGFRLVVTKRHEKYLKVRVKRKNILPCFLRSS